MSMNATLTGALVVSPQTVSDEAFPSAIGTVSLEFSPRQKPIQVGSGYNHRNVNSSGAFVPLSGVGATDAVTQGLVLYVRAKVPFQVRVSVFNPAVPLVPDTAIIPITGTLLIEFDPTRYLVLLEAKGSGLIEWLVVGNQ